MTNTNDTNTQDRYIWHAEDIELELAGRFPSIDFADLLASDAPKPIVEATVKALEVNGFGGDEIATVVELIYSDDEIDQLLH